MLWGKLIFSMRIQFLTLRICSDMIESTNLSVNAYVAIVLSVPSSNTNFASKCDINFLIVFASSAIAWLLSI